MYTQINNLINHISLHPWPCIIHFLPTNAFFWPSLNGGLKIAFPLDFFSCYWELSLATFEMLPPCEQACTSRLQTCGPADSRNEQKYMSKVILKHVRLQLNEMGKRISTLNCWPIDTQINKMAISFKQLLNKLALSHSILGWFTVQLFQLHSSHFYSRILKIRTCLKRYTLRNP